MKKKKKEKHSLLRSNVPLPPPRHQADPQGRISGDTTPCRMTGVTLHSHVHYKETHHHLTRKRLYTKPQGFQGVCIP